MKKKYEPNIFYSFNKYDFIIQQPTKNNYKINVMSLEDNMELCFYSRDFNKALKCVFEICNSLGKLNENDR